MYKGIPTQQGVDLWPVTTQIPVVVRVTNTADIKIAAAAMERIRPVMSQFFARCRKEHFVSGLNVMSRHWEGPEGRLRYTVVHNREMIFVTISGSLLDELTEKNYVIAVRVDPGYNWYVTPLYGVVSPAEPVPTAGITTVKKVDHSQGTYKQVNYNFIDVNAWIEAQGTATVDMAMWVGVPIDAYVASTTPVPIGFRLGFADLATYYIPSVCGEASGGTLTGVTTDVANPSGAADGIGVRYLEMSYEDRVASEIWTYWVAYDEATVMSWAYTREEAAAIRDQDLNSVQSAYPQWVWSYDPYTSECLGTTRTEVSSLRAYDGDETIDVDSFAPLRPNIQIVMAVIELAPSDPLRSAPGDDMVIHGVTVENETCTEIFDTHAIPIYNETFRPRNDQESKFKSLFSWEEIRINFTGVLTPVYSKGATPFQAVSAVVDYDLYDQWLEDVAWAT